jgi:hypothetical protein
MIDRTRRLAGIALIGLTVAAGASYAGWRINEQTGLDLSRTGTILYISPEDGRVHQAIDDKVVTGPTCQRTHAAAGTLICLRPTAVPGGHEVAVFDRANTERKVIPVWGMPSRARVSGSGRLVAWTVFRTGDSYQPTGMFSTTAGAYDLHTDAHYGTLEDFTSIVDGREHTAADRNFWGITFAGDDRTFYATMASGGRTWLMRGDLEARRMESLRQNVECPSLSPDGTRIAYKFRAGGNWRLHVLDLASGKDIPLAEPENVDDQASWLDGNTISYARPVGGAPMIFAVPADGTGHPRPVRTGFSPLELR